MRRCYWSMCQAPAIAIVAVSAKPVPQANGGANIRVPVRDFLRAIDGCRMQTSCNAITVPRSVVADENTAFRSDSAFSEPSRKRLSILFVTFAPPIPTWGGAMAFYRHFVERNDFEIKVVTTCHPFSDVVRSVSASAVWTSRV